MHLLRMPRRPESAPGHPHHGRPAQRAGKLARLSLLERRARRHLDRCRARRPSDSIALRASSAVTSVRPLARSKAAASPSTVPSFRSTRPRCPTCASAIGRRASCSRRRRDSSSSSRPASRAGARRCASAARPASTAFVDIAAPFATGLHQVDNPVFDRDGNLYVTYSGTRGQEVPVSIFRVRAQRHARDVLVGHRQPDVDGDRSGRRAVRVEPVRGRRVSRGDGRHAPSRSPPTSASRAASRSRRRARCSSAIGRGTIFRVDRDGTADARSRRCRPSVAAFHLAIGPGRRAVRDGARRSSSYDARVPHRSPTATVRRCRRAFGRPQGLAFDAGRHAATSSRRWPARAGCIGSRRTARPSSSLAGPRAGRRGLRAARRPGRASRTTPAYRSATLR